MDIWPSIYVLWCSVEVEALRLADHLSKESYRVSISTNSGSNSEPQGVENLIRTTEVEEEGEIY